MGDADNDNFFKCIQKALEVLSNPERRRQFDSVDPYYQSLEDDVDPSDLQKKCGKTPDAFFKSFAPIFQREARFSKITPVPLLGDVDATKEEVQGFYDFWYKFDSWRSFEYLDKEVNEGSDRFVRVSSTPKLPQGTNGFLSIAAMTSATQRRRTNPNEHDARRKIIHGSELSSILRLGSIHASRELNKKKKRSASGRRTRASRVRLKRRHRKND